MKIYRLLLLLSSWAHRLTLLNFAILFTCLIGLGLVGYAVYLCRKEEKGLKLAACLMLWIGAVSLCAFQTHTFPALDTNNIFTGSNTFSQGITLVNASPATTAALTNPAWRGFLLASDFGCVGDGSTDNTACLNAMIAYSNANASSSIVFPCGQFMFNSKPNSFGVGTYVTGCATGSTTSTGTFLEANYNEATCASSTNCNGFLTWDGSFSTALGTGGGLRNVTVYRPGNKTAGAAIKLTGADDNHRAGWWRGDHIIVTGNITPAGTWSYGWLVDGHNNTTSGTQGIRDIACVDCWFTNTTVADSSVFWVNCAKCFWLGGEAFQAGGSAGSAGVTLTGTGGAAPATADSVENTVMATISGDVVIDQVSNARVISEHVLGNMTITSNASAANFFGRVDGTVSNSSTTSIAEIDGVGGTNNTLSNVGGPMGAVASGQLPPTQTAGNLYARSGATAGNVFYGDGSCFAGMASASTFNFNCGNTGIFTFAGTTTLVKIPAIQSTGTAAALTGTGACATFSTQTGGSSVGRATCTGTTGASTITITPGITATNGWVCSAFDQTTRANLLQQTSTSTTACTLTATSVTQNDVFVFTATAF